MAGLPALPHPLTAEQVRDTDVVPEIKKRVFELDYVSDPMLPLRISSEPQEQSTKPPLPPSTSSKPSRKIKPVPLKSKKVTGKEKPTIGNSGTSKKQEKTPKKNNKATSSSTVNAKEKSDGKPKKNPTPGTRASPRIRANLTASVSATPTEEVEETPDKSEAETLDFDVDQLSSDGNDAVKDSNAKPEEESSKEEDADQADITEANGSEKLKCSYKKCNNLLATKEQLSCAVSSCSKKIHAACFQHYLSQANFNFEVRTDVFCCATKACCTKFRVGNQGPTTRWDSDGPNGPNTVPNSETVLLDWWTTGDNWSKYRGGKGDNGKTGVTKKEQTWKKLSDEIKKAGITVARNARAVGAKIARMESEYKNAHDFVNNTGQGLMDEGKDITEIVKKMCSYYYMLDPIMGNRASTKPLELFESEGKRELSFRLSTPEIVLTQICFPAF